MKYTVIAICALALFFSGFSYFNIQNEKAEKAYRNEINALKIENDKKKKEIKENKTQKEYDIKSSNLESAAKKDINDSEEKIKDKNVEVFYTSF